MRELSQDAVDIGLEKIVAEAIKIDYGESGLEPEWGHSVYAVAEVYGAMHKQLQYVMPELRPHLPVSLYALMVDAVLLVVNEHRQDATACEPSVNQGDLS